MTAVPRLWLSAVLLAVAVSDSTWVVPPAPFIEINLRLSGETLLSFNQTAQLACREGIASILGVQVHDVGIRSTGWHGLNDNDIFVNFWAGVRNASEANRLLPAVHSDRFSRQLGRFMTAHGRPMLAENIRALHPHVEVHTLAPSPAPTPGPRSPTPATMLTAPPTAPDAGVLISASCRSGEYFDAALPSADTSCQPCPAGRAQPSSAQSECLACPPGRFQPATGATACPQCPAGRHRSAAQHPAECVECAAGERSSASRVRCRPGCGPGEYLRAAAAGAAHGAEGVVSEPSGASVVSLPAGWGSPSSCERCPPGRFQPATGAQVTACAACEPSQFSTQQREGCVSLCPFGTSIAPASTAAAAASTAAAAAAAAAAGAAGAGAGACEHCAVGRYQPTAVQASCLLCPLGYSLYHHADPSRGADASNADASNADASNADASNADASGADAPPSSGNRPPLAGPGAPPPPLPPGSRSTGGVAGGAAGDGDAILAFRDPQHLCRAPPQPTPVPTPAPAPPPTPPPAAAMATREVTLTVVLPAEELAHFRANR